MIRREVISCFGLEEREGGGGREEVPGDEKIEKQLVGVGDEEGLKKMIDSEEESDSDEEDLTKKLLNNDGERKKELLDIEERGELR
ncbi:unnamed protein product [Strongylus vulgaris]|uniref:Uncharacterized protein n=1 Tax=Strongylus vulgaris TaxID=40348 RepID=A0A3P7LUB7_STRVU|nr:unnamed protein product [Strongylus vulgaris]